MPAGVEPARAHHSGCAQILCSRDGKFVFVSTRTDNRIVSFAVDPSSGGLTRISDVSCQGVCPRNFNIEGESAPKRLRVCNQDTQTIASFEVKSDGNLVEPPTILPLEGVCPSNITLPCVLPEW
jgi:6-phosphogluconolactonase (cycloisomerase 2 family)